MVRKKPTVISLFAGCGGSSLGYKWAGYKELLAVDFDILAVEVFNWNFPKTPCWLKDIKEVSAKEIIDACKIKKGELDLLDASPPCQGFSIAGKQKILDPRNDLFLEFVRLIKGLNPKVFLMENVPGLIRGKMKGRFIEIMNELKALPYKIKCQRMNTKYYQVPQARERLIWIGYRNNLKLEPTFPIPNNVIITVKRAWEGKEFTDLDGTELRGIFKDLIKHWRPGETGSKPYNRHSRSNKSNWFNSRRLTWNKPSPVICKTSRSAIVHPELNRKITINEMKLLQSFPIDFKLPEQYIKSQGVIGNSVPPKFMEALARNIKQQVFNINQ